MKLLIYFFVIFITTISAKHEIYQGWRSYWMEANTAEQQKILQNLTISYELDWIQNAAFGREGLALVKPQYIKQFLLAIESSEVKFRVHSEDVKISLDKEDEVITAHRNTSLSRNGGRSLPYDAYITLDEIYQYMIEIAANYPDTVKLHHPADSFEGRPLYYLTLSTTNFEDPNKPVIFIDGGIHAREWVAPPTVTYAIHKLVEDITERDLVDNIDWVLFPVVNPDGYDYTHTDERFWRKTRSFDLSNPLTILCRGVDGNRNYDYEWNVSGTSDTPCGETYAGSIPFSEIETRIVRDIVLNNLDRMVMYLSMHSYASMILYPWGNSVSEQGVALHKVSSAMAKAIDAVKNPEYPDYIVGISVSSIGYGATGTSKDWVHSVGVKLSYTWELPGLGGGYIGFNPDPSELVQFVTETWEGIKVGARLAIATYRRNI